MQNYQQNNNMKRLLIASILFSVLACNDVSSDKSHAQITEDFKSVQMQLIDSLGMITFSVPIKYDTSFSWVHYSDCGKPCDEQKYRFQPKTLPMFKESGWIWDEAKDSVERFTISHTMYIPFREGDTAKNFGRHSHLKEQLLSNPDMPSIVFDTIQRINDRYYSVIAMEKTDSSKIRATVLAITTIKGNEIKFQYELLTTPNDSTNKDFIKNSMELLKTIRISNGI